MSRLEFSSTLYPSNNSLRNSSEGSFGKFTPPSRFKNQLRFKSAEEMKLPTPPARLGEKISSEAFTLQKIKFMNQNDEEDSENICDESSPESLSKNFPMISPRMKKHPNQRV